MKGKKSMAKVYLVQEVPIDRETLKPKFDITPALKYGEIVVISKRLAQMQFSPGPLILEIKKKLKDFNPEEDYILNYGDPNIIQSVGSILAIKYKKYKTLKWDRRQESYYTIEMDFGNIG